MNFFGLKKIFSTSRKALKIFSVNSVANLCVNDSLTHLNEFITHDFSGCFKYFSVVLSGKCPHKFISFQGPSTLWWEKNPKYFASVMTLIWFKGCRMIRSEKRLKQCDNTF